MNCNSNFRLGFATTKEHPDELQKKSKWTNKQTLVSGIAAGLLACTLLAIILTVKFNSNGNTKHTTSE